MELHFFSLAFLWVCAAGLWDLVGLYDCLSFDWSKDSFHQIFDQGKTPEDLLPIRDHCQEPFLVV